MLSPSHLLLIPSNPIPHPFSQVRQNERAHERACFPTHRTSDVVHDDGRMSVPVVHGSQRLVSLLSCCVPDLSFGSKREEERVSRPNVGDAVAGREGEEGGSGTDLKLDEPLGDGDGLSEEGGTCEGGKGKRDRPTTT